MTYLRAIRLNEAPEESSYLHELPAVVHLGQLNSLTFEQPVTFLVGENGTGKSTILEAIAIAMGFNPEGGGREHTFATRETHSQLNSLITTVKSVFPPDGFFLRAESFYNMASYLEDNSEMKRYGGKSLHQQSHGEAFLSLVSNRFEGPGLYLLDEPESALSPVRQMSLLVEMDRLVKAGSQFIIATHSPILMAFPKAQIYQFSQDGIESVRYQDTEHYTITRQFLEDPERMLHYLLEDDN